MPIVRLTHRGIGALTAGKWMTDYWDDRLPGFGVRVSNSGRKTFLVRYSSADGRKRRLTLGPVPTLGLADARDKAREVMAGSTVGRILRRKRRQRGRRRPSGSWRCGPDCLREGVV